MKEKSWFFEKINKTEKSLSMLTERQRENLMNKIRNEKGYIKADIEKIQRTIRTCF